MPRTFDPILVEVIKNELASVNEEMAIAVFRTARSVMVKIGDFATTVYDRQGRVIGEGAAAFQVGIFAEVISNVLRKYGGSFKPGDVIVTNDPYAGAGHMPDIVLVASAFWRGELVAFTLAYSHHTDTGGRFPGGFTSLCSESFEEGLRLPIMKFYEAGEPNEALVQLISANVRTPDEWMGDAEAKVAGCRRGEQEIQKLLDKYGLAVFESTCDFLVDHAEQACRAAISRIPPGEYHYESVYEDEGLGTADGNLPVKVTLRVFGDNLTVDLTGTAAQAKTAINCPLGLTRATVYGAVKSIVEPDVLLNIGFTRPINIVVPSGTVLNPNFPAAVGGRAPLCFVLFDLIFRALAKAMPQKMPIAGEGGDVMHFTGRRQDGAEYSFMDGFFGGWGGRPTKDGIDGVAPVMFGAYGSPPAEIMEREYPVVYEGFGYVPDTEGAGKYRGSVSVYKKWRFLAPGAVMLQTNRLTHASQGLAGGGAGSLSLNVLTSEGIDKVLPRQTHFHLDVKPGDSVYHVIAGAGGYGRPWERDIENVVADVKDGKVTIAGARTHYSVVIDPNTLRVNEEETRMLRSRLDRSAS
jgi:N-methylhydantoinase B